MTQADNVNQAIAEFGRSVTAKAKSSTDGQPEDQLRGPLEALIALLALEIGLPVNTVTMTGETSLADSNVRPDYAVDVRGALVGFIEVKKPGKGADPRRFSDAHDKAQWAKLKALPNLLYTDGDSFALWRDGALVGDVVRLEGGVDRAGAKLTAPATLLSTLNDFLRWQPEPPRNVRDLARTSARLCRYLRDEVAEQLARGNQTLQQLKADWRTLLFPEADDAKFADGYAQAVTFGLLMAKSKGLSLANGADAAAKALGKTNTLIGTALRLLTEDELAQTPSLRTMMRVLDVVHWPTVAKDDTEAWLYFYEHFLDVYDKDLRKLTGSYYTPPEVVKAMVRLCDEALKSSSRFGIAQGLAHPDVHIADPATGSGTFLLAIVNAIAEAVRRDEGEGAVGPALNEAAKRLYGFELQFGPFAVAQLRLMAEMIELQARYTDVPKEDIAAGDVAIPHLFVTDTLADPYADLESGQGIYREISRSRQEANAVKRTTPITVVIGNPPYKEKAKGKGAWVESGSGNRAAPLNDWQAPAAWGVGAHAKHLRNLYIYFWRWAAWKVFEQGRGGRDLQPQVAENLSGLVCYITVSGFLNGPGFQKMRADLRRDCDDIWIVDCSPEGHQPQVATRIFQGVQHPVCIVLASRSPESDPAMPARVRFRSLAKGRRDAKFAELEALSLDTPGWQDCSTDERAPFLPDFVGGWGEFLPLDTVLGDIGPGIMPGRTWVVAPDSDSLVRRWKALQAESDMPRKEMLFHPQLRGGEVAGRHIRKFVGEPLGSIQTAALPIIDDDGSLAAPTRYSLRSFDRQWLPVDARLLNDPRPKIWAAYGSSQIHLTAPMDLAPSGGPAATLTASMPDQHHYAGRGGRVFALYKNAAATETNVSPAVIASLSKAYGAPVDPVDIFAYVAALLANPVYVERFRADLIRPGLRVPLTADAALFAEAAAIGRQVIWLHSFGERMADGHPAGPPRLPDDRRPTIPKGGSIPTTPEDFPDSIDHDAGLQRLFVGKGYIDRVPAAVWTYEVSGKQVLRQWFSYRKKNRERPQIGDRCPPSPLGDIQPDHWLPEYTSELLNVLNILGLLVDMEPAQADLLDRICDEPLLTVA